MIGKLFEEILEFIKAFFEKEEAILLVFILLLGGVFFLNVFNPITIDFSTIGNYLWNFFLLTWWLWLFFILFPIFTSLWLFWRNELTEEKMDYPTFEIKIPRNNQRGPQAMEQILIAMNSLDEKPDDFGEKWIDGDFLNSHSLEIASFGGEVHFYIRFYRKYELTIKSVFYANYPDIELEEVEDYTHKLPHDYEDMKKKGLNLWGLELKPRRSGLYPIKTYTRFEQDKLDEEKQIDPLASILELAAHIGPEEFFGIQLIISCLPKHWGEEYDEELEKMRERKKQEKHGAEKENLASLFVMRSPGQTEVLKEVERNLSKPAFETIIRMMHVAPKEILAHSNLRRALVSALRQYDTTDMNAFIYNDEIQTRVRVWKWPYFFPRVRLEMRRQRMLYLYHHHKSAPETWIGKLLTSHIFNSNFLHKPFPMNVEAIATLFHVPTSVILTAPHLKQVESRKTGAPRGVAIFGEEEDIERFK